MPMHCSAGVTSSDGKPLVYLQRIEQVLLSCWWCESTVHSLYKQEQYVGD